MQLIELNKAPVKSLLPILLSDKTTGRNIIFATDAYTSFGFDEKTQITKDDIQKYLKSINSDVVKVAI